MQKRPVCVCEGHLFLADTLVPQPLVEDFILEGTGASDDALLDGSDRGGVFNDLNHSYRDDRGRTDSHGNRRPAAG